MARGLLEREILLPRIFRQDVKPFLGAVPELRAPNSSAGMEAEVLRAGVEELGPGTGGLQPRAQGLTSARPGSGGKHGFGSKTQSGRRGSSLLEAARCRAAMERWGSRRKCPVGREQKGSICSSPSRADSSSIAVREFLHGEKTQRTENPFKPEEKNRTRRKNQKPGSKTLTNTIRCAFFTEGDGNLWGEGSERPGTLRGVNILLPSGVQRS